MVATRIRFSGLHHFFRSDPSRKKRSALADPNIPTLGILAFETARTMAHLISIYNALCPAQINTLRNVVFRSDGIQYLNSTDESHLLNLAFAEKIDELDRAAASVARLCAKSLQRELRGFDRIYADLKMGAVDLPKLAFPTKEVPREIAKMEKLVVSTAELHAALEALSSMESSGMKLQQEPTKDADAEIFEKNLTWQREHVQRLREVCLWSQPFDAVTSAMSRFVYNVFARMCIAFAPYVPDLPQVISNGNVVFLAPKQVQFNPFRSGPLERSFPKDITSAITASGPLYQKTPCNGIGMLSCKESTTTHQESVLGSGEKRRIFRKRPRITKWAAPTTVGGSGLALRYADIVILADKILKLGGVIDKEMREDLYRLLPVTLQKMVNAKIRKCLGCDKSWSSDEMIAQGWREALGQILGWLAPMAYNMIIWQTERSLEQKQFDSQSTVLLLETLYFSDKEKTEAAITEVLAGLSCICRYQHCSLQVGPMVGSQGS